MLQGVGSESYHTGIKYTFLWIDKYNRGHLSEFILLGVTDIHTAFILWQITNIIFQDVCGNIKKINWVRFLTWDKQNTVEVKDMTHSLSISRPSKTFIVLAPSDS